MSNLKQDGMRMPTVGSNDQLARTTVTGQNVFDKLVPAKLPGQRPPTDSPLNQTMAQRQALMRGLQLRTGLKEANEKPFYGTTGALYKPEFGPVVSQVPPPQPVKRSPKTPFPAQVEQAAFSPKQAVDLTKLAPKWSEREHLLAALPQHLTDTQSAIQGQGDVDKEMTDLAFITRAWLKSQKIKQLVEARKKKFQQTAEYPSMAQKQAESIHVNNIDDPHPIVVGFVKRAAELGMSQEHVTQAIEKLAQTEAFSEVFEKKAFIPSWISKNWGKIRGAASNAAGKTRTFFNQAGDAAKTWQQASRSRAAGPNVQFQNRQPRQTNWNPFYDSNQPGAVGGVLNSRAAQGLRGAAVGGGVGAGMDTAEYLTGYDTGTNWTGTMAGVGGLGGFVGRRNPFYNAQLGQRQGTYRGLVNSDLMHGIGGSGRGWALGMGVDALEDATGYDSGYNWSSIGGTAGGLLGYGRMGRRLNRMLPNHAAFRGPGASLGMMSRGMDQTKGFLPAGLNRRQAAGWTLAVGGMAYPWIKNYAQQQGTDAARGVADTMARQLGFNDSVSAMASPIGQALAGYYSGGLGQGAQNFMQSLVNRPQVIDGVTTLPNQMNADSVWAALSEYANMLRKSNVPPDQQKTLLAQLVSTFSQAPGEVQRQVQ